MRFTITDNFDPNCWVGTPQNIRICGPLDINQFVIGKVISKVYICTYTYRVDSDEYTLV